MARPSPKRIPEHMQAVGALVDAGGLSLSEVVDAAYALRYTLIIELAKAGKPTREIAADPRLGVSRERVKTILREAGISRPRWKHQP